jgi:hypothetical protein
MSDGIQLTSGERLSVVVLGASEESNRKLMNAALRLPQRFVVIGERTQLVEQVEASLGKPVECFPAGTAVPAGEEVLVFDEALIAAWAERARHTSH